jgi:hypothetical protein
LKSHHTVRDVGPSDGAIEAAQNIRHENSEYTAQATQASADSRPFRHIFSAINIAVLNQRCAGRTGITSAQQLLKSDDGQRWSHRFCW